MTFWDFDVRFGDVVLDFAILNALLLAGFVCRWKIPLFQRYLIPSSLIAGFLGLTLGPELLGMLDFQTERMELYLYHLLAILFVSIGLQKPEAKKTRGAIHFGLMFVTSYLLQILIGIGCMLFITYLFNPDLVPAIGMLLPLGFGMGPGIAATIGHSWQTQYGVEGASSIGLTISAIGFLIAYFAGMTLVNRGIRAGKSVLLKEGQQMTPDLLTGVISGASLTSAGRLRFHGSSIEPLTFHFGLVGSLYLLTFLATSGLELLLRMGGVVEQLSTLWGFHFIIANLLALATRHLLARLEGDYLLDNGLNHRITGLFTDYLIAAAIMGISLSVAWDYALPILLMCVLGALATGFVLHFLTYRLFSDFPFERFTGVFGEMTGTIASGLALVRVTDPEFRTPIAQDLGLGSGVALLAGFPLLLLINTPFVYYDGRLYGYWVVIGITLAYLLFIFGIWILFGLKLRRTQEHTP